MPGADPAGGARWRPAPRPAPPRPAPTSAPPLPPPAAPPGRPASAPASLSPAALPPPAWTMRQALPPAAPCPRPRPPQHPLSLHHLRLHQQLILWRWQRAEAVRVGPSGTRCRAAGSGGDARRLSDAASQYIQGLKAGVDEDDLVAQELGVSKAAELSDVQQRYKDQIRAKLAQVTPMHLFRVRSHCLDSSARTLPGLLSGRYANEGW